MSYSIYGLNEMKSPVVIRTTTGETEYKDGIDAGRVKYEKPQLINSIKAIDSKIIVELVENKHFQDVSWSERTVNIFDGD